MYDLQDAVNHFSAATVVVGVLLLVLLAVATYYLRRQKKAVVTATNKPLFFGFLATIALVTVLLGGARLFINSQSFAGGPVHWQAGIEFWACGNELELRDPPGTVNYLGRPTLYERNDKTLHVEGVPVTPQDASLGSFMQAIGGELSSDALTVPLNSAKYYETNTNEKDGDGYGAPATQYVEPYVMVEHGGTMARFVSGQMCGSTPAEVQVFVYQFDAGALTYTQTKLAAPADYIITHEGSVPPGDCVIVEFAPTMERTNKLCAAYGRRDSKRCVDFGVPAAKKEEMCTFKEVGNG